MSEPDLNLHEPAPPAPHRPARKWLALLLAWAVGLCVWAGYIGLLFIGFLKLFS